MKKKIKNKCLPKFSDSGTPYKSDSYQVDGPVVEYANTNMKEGYDSGKSSTPNYDKKINPSLLVGTIGNSLNTIGNFIPEDNDNFGVSRKGQKISSGIQSGLGAAADIANSIPGGQIIGSALKIGQFLTKGFTAIADAVKEKKNPRDERWNQMYNPVNENSSGLNFGLPQGKFGLPLYALGGVTYEQADIEAEKGEAMLGPDNNIQNIGGRKHEQGGTPLALKGNEQYIYSDRLGYDKNGIPTININDVAKTFADKAKSIERKYSKKKDPIAEKTKELELSKLTQDAEQTRQVKEQLDMSKDIKKIQAKYGKNLKKFIVGGPPGPPTELDGDPYSQWTNLFYNKSGQTLYPDANMYSNLMNKPYMNTTVGMFQSWVKDQDKTMLPKYGIDGKWGKETQAAWNKYGSQYTKLISDSPSKGIVIAAPVNTNQINSPLFTDNLPSGPQQDMNGIDIEKPGDDFGAGIVVYNTPENATQRNGLFQNLTQGDKLQLAGMFPGALYNIGMGLKKAEKEKFYTNPYQNQIIGLMQNRKFDAQAFINEAQLANTAVNEEIGNNASSVGVKLSNLQKAHANYMNSIASITGRAQEINNGYRADEANIKNQLGEVLRQEGIRQAQVNAQNKATKQAFMAKGITQVGQGISAIGQASNQSLTNIILAKSLSEISPDFDINELKDLYNRGKVDKDGYFYFNGVKYQYIPHLNQVIKA